MHKKEPDCFYSQALYVGVRRFELPTSATRTQRAARLRYTPNWIANVVIFLEKKNDPDVFFFAKKNVLSAKENNCQSIKNIDKNVYLLSFASFWEVGAHTLSSPP